MSQLPPDVLVGLDRERADREALHQAAQPRKRSFFLGASIMAAMLGANDAINRGGYPLQAMSAKRRRKYLHDVRRERHRESFQKPHIGEGECERRRRQIAKGQLTVSNGLAV